MQLTTLAPAAALALISVSSTSATALAGENPVLGPPIPVKASNDGGVDAKRKTSDADVGYLLHQMEELVHMGQPIDDSLEQLRKMVAALPGSPDAKGDLFAVVDALDDRSATAFVDPLDIADVRKQFAWTRIDEAMKISLDTIEDGPEAIGRLAADLEPITGGICTAYVPFQAQRFQGTLREAFVHQEQFAGSTDEWLLGVRYSMVQSRLQQARQLLAFRLQNSTAVRGDYHVTYRLLVLRAHMLGQLRSLDPS